MSEGVHDALVALAIRWAAINRLAIDMDQSNDE